jgi:hypothetical protein
MLAKQRYKSTVVMPEKMLAVNKEWVATFVSRWSDQKLAEVLAFAQDGKMSYQNQCCCLLGVASSDNLHVEHCHNYGDQESHYHRFRNETHRALSSEMAYFGLGYHQEERDFNFIQVLEEVIARREALHETIQEAKELACN